MGGVTLWGMISTTAYSFQEIFRESTHSVNFLNQSQRLIYPQAAEKYFGGCDQFHRRCCKTYPRPIQYKWEKSLPFEYVRNIWRDSFGLPTTISGYLNTPLVECTNQPHQKLYWCIYYSTHNASYYGHRDKYGPSQVSNNIHVYQ